MAKLVEHADWHGRGHSLKSGAGSRESAGPHQQGGLSPKLRCYDQKKGEYTGKRKVTGVLFSGVTTLIMLWGDAGRGSSRGCFTKRQRLNLAPLRTLHDKSCGRKPGRCLYFVYVNHGSLVS